MTTATAVRAFAIDKTHSEATFQVRHLITKVRGRFADFFRDRPAWVVVGGTCLLLTFLTEFTSNVATVSAVLPFLAQAAVALQIDPRLLLIPATAG